VKKKLWVFSFEFAGIKKVGGLGEVPANQTKWLSKDYDITLFMPAHGICNNEDKIKKLNLIEMEFECRGNINALEHGLGDMREEYKLGFMTGKINGIKVILIYGKNKFSSEIIDDPVVYSPDTLNGKFILFSRAIKAYTKYVLENYKENIPDLIHCHDHHGIPALICARQELNKAYKDVATIFTIHLLTWPRISLKFLWECGIEDLPMNIFINGTFECKKVSEIYKIAKDNNDMDASLERLGAIFTDVITSVSQNYLKNDIVKNFGEELLKDKDEFFWNGCDWDYEKIKEEVLQKYSKSLEKYKINGLITRKSLKLFVELEGIGALPSNEPKVESEKIKQALISILNRYPYKKEDNVYCGRVYPFKEEGPLIIMTGRLSPMKGVDLLLDSVPLILKNHPKAKFLLFLIPSEFTLNEIKPIVEKAYYFEDNIRILFGKVYSMFFPAYISADIYCAPSRWEPFGIIALEAMVSKTPVVATKVGGLCESVLDLNKEALKGTGILVSPDNVEELATAISDLIFIMKIAELHDQYEKKSENNNLLQKTNADIERLIEEISSPNLKTAVKNNPKLWHRIQENCLKRVETKFRWKIVSQKLISIYNKALLIKDKRINKQQ